MKFACFDLETARILPDEVDDLFACGPLGISCAALALSDRSEPFVWQGVPQCSQQTCRDIIDVLCDHADRGYTIVTWNGCGFDFRILAEESCLAADCGALALDHVDLMMIVTFTKGWYLGLDKALAGAGLEGKKQSAVLSDGTSVSRLGSRAPALWAAGEYPVVLEYLKQDVSQLLRLAEAVEHSRTIQWLSASGRPQVVSVPKMLTARECFSIPPADTSWMTSPAPRRESFVAWIPGFGQ